MSNKSDAQPREHKVSPIFVTKVDATQGIVDAIVNVFGVVDEGRDVDDPGAFRKTLLERFGRLRVLDSHNSYRLSDVIGIPLSAREITRAELPADVLAQYPTATGGLLTSTKYLLNTPEGLGAFQRIESGAIKEYSIGF